MSARLLEVENLRHHVRLAAGWLAGSGGVMRAVDGVSFHLDDECARLDPALLSIGDRHAVACHLHGPTRGGRPSGACVESGPITPARGRP